MDVLDRFVWTDLLELRTAKKYRAETLVHRAADLHASRIDVAVRYAFALGRKSIDMAALRTALTQIRTLGGPGSGRYPKGSGVPRDARGILIDKLGNPLTVYHGSVSRDIEVTALDPNRPMVRSRPGQLNGVYFTSDALAASGYTRIPRAGIRVPAGRVMSAHLSMQNPLDITRKVAEGQKKGLTFGDAKREALKLVTPDHDGTVFRGDDYNSDEYLVFSQSQIHPTTKVRALEVMAESGVQAALTATAAAPDAVAKGLRQVLPAILLAALRAGGEAGVAILRGQLRTAGGSGSGNFGHSGRPGVVGGSSSRYTGSPAWIAMGESRDRLDAIAKRLHTEGAPESDSIDDLRERSTEYDKAFVEWEGLQKKFYAQEREEKRIAALPENVRKAEIEVKRIGDLLVEAEAAFWKMPDIREPSLYQPKEFQAARKELERLADEYTKANATLEKTHSDNRIERVTRRTTNMATQMDYDVNQIDIVDKDPREFTVGNLQFKEAGHFNPATGRIQINARNTDDDIMSQTTIVVAHEIAHAQYDVIEKQRAEEHDQLRGIRDSEHMSNVNPATVTLREKWFTKHGSIKAEALTELRERFPASALWADTFGDGFLDSQNFDQPIRNSDKMREDDGVSDYSKAYWTPEAVAARGHSLETAVNETLAEVRRMIEVPNTRTGDKTPSKEWAMLARGIGQLYAKQQASRGYHPPDAQGRKYGEPGYRLAEQPRVPAGSPEGGQFASSERFGKAGAMVDGRVVLDDVPNTGSIEATLTNYEILPGIREIPMSAMDHAYQVKPYSVSESDRLDKLQTQIETNNKIAPLIIVVDNEQHPYILEGGHRYDALRRMGAKSFPALVVLDLESLKQ